jgi:hypothetical protein
MRSLTAQFISKRKRSVSNLELETNRLLGRLGKLARALNEADFSAEPLIAWPGTVPLGTQIEQSIVPWEDERLRGRCSVCNADFGVFGRCHHCRLCGRALCTAACSATMPLSNLCMPLLHNDRRGRAMD